MNHVQSGALTVGEQASFPELALRVFLNLIFTTWSIQVNCPVSDVRERGLFTALTIKIMTSNL